MKLSTTLLTALLAAGSLAATAYAPPSQALGPSVAHRNAGSEAGSSLSLPFGDEPDVMIVAHRGQWRAYPENSIPGILQAADDGADIVEIDLARTKDGHLVLMHDATVNRTTDGAGRVDAMTLEEIKALNLREGQGNGPAPLTTLKVPTFKEVLEASQGVNILLNLDKGWAYRDQLVDELRATGMAGHALFKGAANAQEAHEFMAEYPDVQLMHALTGDQASEFEKFTTHMPEVIAAAPELRELVGAKTDLWANSLAYAIGGVYTDEASLRDPDLGWQYLANHGIDAIQTDNVRMMHAWREGIDVTTVGLKAGSVRLQAEDFIDDPAYYRDNTAKNDCGARAIGSPTSPVDACDLDGAHIVQYIRDGEHFTLEVEIDKPGKYTFTMRHSSDTEPGGTVTVDTGDGPGESIVLPNQTHNRAFTVTDLGQYQLSQGTHRIKLEFTHPDYMSVDWLQLDRGTFLDHGLLR